MKLIIVGFGRVGRRTADTLRNEGHEVVIVDNDRNKVDRAADAGFEVIEGDGAEEAVLKRAGVAGADALGGFTGDINTNFAACVIGDANGCRTVIRVSEDFNTELYERYSDNVDEVIYPERLGAAGAKTALLGGDLNVLADLTEGLSAASIRVPDGSPVIGKRVVEIELPDGAQIYAHGRADEPMNIPLPQTTVSAGDSLAVVTSPETITAIRNRLSGEEAA